MQGEPGKLVSDVSNSQAADLSHIRKGSWDCGVHDMYI